MSPHLDVTSSDEAGIEIHVDKPHQSDDTVEDGTSPKADLRNRAAGILVPKSSAGVHSANDKSK